MCFIVDAQLPPALARFLAEKGHAAEHVQDLGMLSAEDMAIWKHAREVGAVIVSKYEGFCSFSVADSNVPRCCGSYWEYGTRDLLSRIDRAWSAVERALVYGEKLVELV